MKKYLKKLAAVTAATAYFTTAASAIDDGPRMYWNPPKDLNVVQTYAWSVYGNSVSPSGAVFQEVRNSLEVAGTRIPSGPKVIKPSKEGISSSIYTYVH